MFGRGSQRGTWWVVWQFTLMFAVLGLGPALRGSWGNIFTLAGGLVLIGLGAWAGIRGSRDLGRNRTPFPEPRAAGELITLGIYARVRHPLYVAVITLSFGWALCWASAAALAAAAATLVLLDLKAREEERRMAARFPGYPDYARRVKRFVPGIY